MITAVVLIDAVHDQIPEVAQAPADIAGAVDRVPGVERTETLIAFRAYSRHDLEAAFSLGLR